MPTDLKMSLSNTGLPAKNGKKAGKSGWSESGNRKAMSSARGCRRQGNVEAEPPAAKNFCIFYLKNVNFSASNCTICRKNVLCIMYHTNTKYSRHVTFYPLYTIWNIQLLQYVMLHRDYNDGAGICKQYSSL